MRRSLLLLPLAACADPSGALPAGEVPPPASIVLELPDPMFAGEVNTFAVTGNLGQQEPVYLVGSPGSPAPGPCPRQLGFQCFGIPTPVILGEAPFDGTEALIDADLSAVTAGTTWSFQAVVLRGRRGSASMFSAPETGTAIDNLPGCTDPAATNYDPSATWDDGSCTFPGVNPPGSVLIPSSDFVDPSPPAGWTQCAGFINTAGDDVGVNALDNCLGSANLRLRIWDAGGVLREDIYSTGQPARTSWPFFDYLGGTSTRVVTTEWNSSTTFFVASGGDACSYGSGYNSGHSFGNGNGNTINVSPADFDPAKEIRINCGGAARVGYRMALYR